MGRKKKKKKKVKAVKKKIEKKASLTIKSTSADQKIEIKKIKKQPTEKKIYKVNNHLFYWYNYYLVIA